MGVQNQVLTNYAAGYVGAQDWSVLDVLAPLVPVQRDVFEYPKYTGGMKQVDDQAGERAPANIVEISETREPDRVPENKLAETITARERRNHMDEGTMDRKRRAKVRSLSNALRLRRAIRLAAIMEDTSTVSNTAATDAFGGGSSAPISDIRDKLIQKVYDQGGMPPNTLVIPRSVYVDLVSDSNFTTEIRGFSVPNPEIITNMFNGDGIERTIIASHSNDTAKEGQTASFGNIWSSSKMWAMHIPMEVSEPTDRSPLKTFYLEDEWNRVETIERRNPDVEEIVEYYSYIQRLTDDLSIHMLTGC